MAQIKHIVTVMFENRSFDNVLGALYPSSSSFEGVGRTKNANVWNGTEYWPRHGTDMIQPFPDPNEEYEFVYRQMFNDFASPWPPPEPSGTPPMSGFVRDYMHAPPSHKSPRPGNIMNYFEPEDVPVISGLAKAYAVCDHWFCSIPSQTLCNRSYVAAGTSSGYVNNLLPNGLPILNKTPTIYNLLNDAGKSWRVYYGNGNSALCATLTTQLQVAQYWYNNFFEFKQFYNDIQKPETFPSYVFIEPNYLWKDPYAENDQHPQAGWTDNPDHPSNVLYGEKLLFDIFTALTQSPEWDSTLLIILFDEHGGTFDHVVPPPAVSPDGVVIDVKQPGGSGFTFDRLGIRVPAVLVSPLIREGTISNVQYDHTSVIRTVINTFGLNTTLLKREEQANDLSSVITLTEPRKDLPTLRVRPTPDVTEELAASFADVPLSEFQKTVIQLGMRFLSTKAPGVVIEPRDAIVTHADAWRILDRLKAIEKTLRG